MLWFSVILFEDGGSGDKHFEQSTGWERLTYRDLLILALQGFKHFAQKVKIQYPAELDWECTIRALYIEEMPHAHVLLLTLD